MSAAGLSVESVRATGGVMRSALWQHLLADVFALPIDLTDGQQGSGHGAALLGMLALGMVDTVETATASATVVATVPPDPGDAAVYARLRPLFAGLYDALGPTFAALRRLDLPR